MAKRFQLGKSFRLKRFILKAPPPSSSPFFIHNSQKEERFVLVPRPFTSNEALPAEKVVPTKGFSG